MLIYIEKSNVVMLTNNHYLIDSKLKPFLGNPIQSFLPNKIILPRAAVLTAVSSSFDLYLSATIKKLVYFNT